MNESLKKHFCPESVRKPILWKQDGVLYLIMRKILFDTIRLSAAHCIFACFFYQMCGNVRMFFQSDISHFVDFNIFLKSGSYAGIKTIHVFLA